MADIRIYGKDPSVNGLPLASVSLEDEKRDDLARERAQWQATIVTFIVLIAMLGAEQVMLVSDAVRIPLGVLTVLLGYGFWNLLCGMIGPSRSKG